MATSSTSLPILRAPQHHNTPAPSAFTLPPKPWLTGTWHVTHSTLPLWKDKRNVAITYNPLPAPDDAKLDDLVTYQTLGSKKVKSVNGVDTPAADASGGGVYNWRGKGWLMIASSRWEILGWGESGAEDGDGGAKEQWVVTYFAKTLFTPAGIDIYSRRREGLSEDVLGKVKAALKEVVSAGKATEFEALVGGLFEIKRDEDGERSK